MISIVVVCAGNSTRMNLGTNKVLLPLGDDIILMHSLKKFKEVSDDIIVVCSSLDIDEVKSCISNFTIVEEYHPYVEETTGDRELLMIIKK